MNRLLILLVLLLPTIPALACPGLVVREAWVREPPPGARGTAAYFTLRNDGAQTLVLDGGMSIGSLTIAEAEFLSVSCTVTVHA